MREKILTKIENLDKIAKEISKIRGVKAVYLFGSYVKRKIHALSDIDLCVIGNLEENERTEIMGYSTDNLDISIFSDLPIWIKMRVLKEGKPSVVNDNKFLDILKIITVKKYIDFRYIINKYCEEVLGCMI